MGTLSKNGKRKHIAVIVLTTFTFLNLLYSNCSKAPEGESADASLSATGVCGEGLSDSVKDITTISQVVNLINVLPKPLSLDCFIRAIKRPLNVFATNSPASVQPAFDADNPRIFIIRQKLILAVVPKGAGKYLLEMSQATTATSSIKAELQFPIQGEISNDAPFSRILEGSYGTSCRICHSNEGLATGTGNSFSYQSNILMPLSASQVSSDYMKAQAMFCNSNFDKYRCQIIRSIFIDGQAKDTQFPY